MAVEAERTLAGRPSTQAQSPGPTRLDHVTPHVRLRLPDAADPNQRSLVEANDRGGRYSIELLRQLLPGFEPTGSVECGSSLPRQRVAMIWSWPPATF